MDFYGWIHRGKSGGHLSTVNGIEEIYGLSPQTGNVYHNFQTTAGGSWSGWNSLGGYGLNFKGGLSAIYNPTANIRDIFIIDTSGTTWHQYLSASNNWSGWISLGGTVVGVPSVSVRNGTEEIYALCPIDGNIYHNYQTTPGGGWSGWFSLGGSGTIASTPYVVVDSNGTRNLYAIGKDGNVWQNYLTTSNQWSGWFSMGNPNTTKGYTISGQINGSSGPLSGVTVTLSGSANESQTTNSNGQYWFAVAAGGTYTVTPTLSGYTFSPASQTFSNLSGNQSSQPAAGQPSVCTTQAATISGTATFWYFGGVSGSSGYSTTTTLTATPPSSSCMSPTITWSTDSPSRLSIAPAGLSATLTSKGASQYQKGYDIHVTVTYNGKASSPFPIFINTPYSMTTSNGGGYCNGSGCDCPAFGYTGYIGYINTVGHGVADLNGNIMTPIVLNESLEKQQWLDSTYSGAAFPSASTWTPGQWNGNNTFTDYFWICAPSAGSLNPPPASYSATGGTVIFNETQKFWVGSGSHFQGTCVERGIVTLYNNHGALTTNYTPITNPADCAQGTTLN